MKTAQKHALEVKKLQAKLLQKNAEIIRKDHQIASLKTALIDLKKYRFGASSEKVDSPQIPLFNEAEVLTQPTAASPTKKKARKKKGSSRKPLPTNLEREEVVHDLTHESDKKCPHDGTVLTCIGEETSEQLLYIPATLKVRVHKRLKYACPCCKKYIVTANKPKDPIPKSQATPELLSYLTVSKYQDALPLYRLGQMFKRMDITLNRTTLAQWMIRCGNLVQPLINLMMDEAINSPYQHLDETPVQVLKEPGRKAKTKSYMWVQCSGPPDKKVTLFHYSPTRSAEIPNKLLSGYTGAIMTDGYEGYAPACRENKIERLGCWVHARRYFIKVLDMGEHPVARQFIELIQQLYTIEKEQKEKTTQERYQYRQTHSQNVLNEIHKLLKNSVQNTAPSGAMGKALTYLQNQWPRLIAYMQHGDYPIDNNRAENAIRPFVIGRKNWLFANSPNGAKASANLYSIIETVKAHGKNPEHYLAYIYRELPNATSVADMEKLLPWNFVDTES